MMAVGLAAALVGEVFAVPVFVFFVPWANTILQHSSTKAMRYAILFSSKEA
jgi:uncharacterized membrane protein